MESGEKLCRNNEKGLRSQYRSHNDAKLATLPINAPPPPDQLVTVYVRQSAFAVAGNQHS